MWLMLTSKCWSHCKIMVIYPQQLLRFGYRRLCHVWTSSEDWAKMTMRVELSAKALCGRGTEKIHPTEYDNYRL